MYPAGTDESVVVVVVVDVADPVDLLFTVEEEELEVVEELESCAAVSWMVV